jgi:hypothetical protein
MYYYAGGYDPHNTFPKKKEVVVTGTTGVENVNDEKNLTVYPVPATDVVYIAPPGSAQTIMSITITGADGKKIRTITPPGNNTTTTLTVADLLDGLYVLHIQTADDMLNRKFTVMR